LPKPVLPQLRESAPNELRTDEYLDPYGFSTLVGIRLVELVDGHSELRIEVGPQLRNRMGIVHGGVLATLLDNACGLAGAWVPASEPVRQPVTLSLAISYLRPGRSDVLTAKGHVTKQGRRNFMASGEVFCQEGKLLATAQSVHQLLTTPGSGSREDKIHE